MNRLLNIRKIPILSTINRPIRFAGKDFRISLGLDKHGLHGPLIEMPDWSYMDGTPGPVSNGQLRRNEAQENYLKVAKSLLREIAIAEEVLRENNADNTDEKL